jgi:hypothetical protein
MWAQAYTHAWGFSKGMDGSPIILDQSEGGRGCPSATQMWIREALDTVAVHDRPPLLCTLVCRGIPRSVGHTAQVWRQVCCILGTVTPSLTQGLVDSSQADKIAPRPLRAVFSTIETYLSPQSPSRTHSDPVAAAAKDAASAAGPILRPAQGRSDSLCFPLS